MPRGAAFRIRRAAAGAGMFAALLLAGCGSFDDASRRVAGALTPHRPPVIQGNFVSREQAEALRPGMTRQQVREVLGTPLVASLFHADRWDYVFTLKRQGVPEQSRRFTVHFKGDVLERFEGDPLPSESEFVGLLDVRRGERKVPVLEATEEQLRRYPAPQRAEAASEPQPPARASYPPLEAAPR